MSFGEAIKTCFQKYATFSGRARRSEYWYFVLFNLLVCIGLYLLDYAIFEDRFYITGIYSLFVLIPGMAVAIRRLHDIGKKGWIYFIFILSCIVLVYVYVLFVVSLLKQIFGGGSEALGYITLILFAVCILTIVLGIILLVWLCRDSQPGTNQYGPNPKEQPNNAPITME